LTRYVIITPARDEEDFLEKTIHAVLNQTVLPQQWILVNDGSVDRTGDIMQRYAALYPWITVLHRGNRGFRNSAGGEIDAFYGGFDQIRSADWEYVVKLDADLSFAPDYFAQCFAAFKADPGLGIAGGTIYHDIEGREALEDNPAFHVRGATKIYRRECWEAIGGLMRIAGWDTIDELKANMLGWRTATLPHLHLLHFRYTGSADGAWRNALKDGRANYNAGYHPAFMLLKCLRRLFKPPVLIGGVGLMVGFLSCYWKRAPRVGDTSLVTYVRDQQLRKLTLRESLWR
jgi:glycosyltransferase involved in cell wall biosynthesis